MTNNVDTIELTYDTKTKEIVFVYGLVIKTEEDGTNIIKTMSTEQRYPSEQIDALMGSVVENMQNNKKMLTEFKERLELLKDIKTKIDIQS
jgi:hypothetical protein